MENGEIAEKGYKMLYKLMAVDIDGTLLDSNGNLTNETIKAIRLGVEKGLIFTICTGRSIQGVKKLNDMIGLDLPYITYNGAMVVKGKSREILHEQKMSYSDAKTVYELGEKNNTTIVVWNDNKLYVNKMNEMVFKYGEINDTKAILIHNIDEVVKNGATKILWYDEARVIEKFEKEVGKYLGCSINYHTSRPIFLEFVDVNASKAIALERLRAYFGIKQSEIIAVGDGANDISMIEYAGLGIAMDNASQVVKQKADYITLSNDEDGVAHVIYKFILG